MSAPDERDALGEGDRTFKARLGPAAVARLGAAFQAAVPDFRRADFEAMAQEGLDALELLGRVEHVARALRAHLAPDFPGVALALDAVRAAWPASKPGETPADLAVWALFPVVPLAALGPGSTQPDFPAGLELLRRLTPLFSAEAVVRPFFERDPAAAFARFGEWLTDPDPHVRRLVSEGTRPRLPWAPRVRRFVTEPWPGLSLCERLICDAAEPSEYVRRSVANHLNDVSRDHAELALACARRWLARGGVEMERLVRHGLRTLVKAGHPEALALLGHGDRLALAEATLDVAPGAVPWGGAATVTARVVAGAGQTDRWVVDYAVLYQGAPGRGEAGPRRRKVFKGRTASVEPWGALELSVRLDFRAITTRRYYPGPHAVELVVNGRTVAVAHLELLPQ